MPSKNKNRDAILRQYGQLYDWHEYERLPGSMGCYYCGDPANTVDHIPPLSAVDTRKTDDWRKDGFKFLKVRCCSACNSSLGPKWLFRPLDRAKYIEERLIRKYEREANLWSEEEIKEMGPEFQRTIRAKKKAAVLLLERLRAAQWRVLREQADS